jgi:hypothetical protein
MKTFSQGTDTWKKVTEGMSISAYSPVTGTTIAAAATNRQVAVKGEEISVSTTEKVFGDLKEASRGMTR